MTTAGRTTGLAGWLDGVAVRVLGARPSPSARWLLPFIAAMTVAATVAFGTVAAGWQASFAPTVAALLVVAAVAEGATLQAPDGSAFSFSGSALAASVVVDPATAVVMVPLFTLAGEGAWAAVTRQSLWVFSSPALLLRSVANVAMITLAVALAAGGWLTFGVASGPGVLAGVFIVSWVIDAVTAAAAAALTRMASNRPWSESFGASMSSWWPVVSASIGVILLVLANRSGWLPLVAVVPMVAFSRLSQHNASALAAVQVDSVSGLRTRQGFVAAVGSVRSGGAVGVRLVEFDATVEALGHRTADEVWRAVGSRLTELTAGRMCGRVSADTAVFTVPGGVAPDVEAHRVKDAVESLEVDIDGAGVPVRVAVGAVEVGPGRPVPADELVLRTELAISAATGGAIGTYDPAVRTTQRALRLASDITAAIRHGQIVAYYQPIVSDDGTSVVGCEALARWHHPDLGTVPPGEWLPIVSRLGLDTELTGAVLAAVTGDVASWDPEIGMSVNINVTATDLGTGTLPDMIATSCAAADIDASILVVEVTEQAATHNPVATAHTIQRLHDLGCRVAVDDFGVGESSLARVADFAFDELKIDRSFTQNLDNHRVRVTVEALIGLGHQLGMTVVVEGVETTEERDMVATLGSDKMQGYLMGAPDTAEALLMMLGMPGG